MRSESPIQAGLAAWGEIKPVGREGVGKRIKFERPDIVRVRLNPTVGPEQQGDNRTRRDLRRGLGGRLTGQRPKRQSFVNSV